MNVSARQPTQHECQDLGSNLLAVVTFRQTNDDAAMFAWLDKHYPSYTSLGLHRLTEDAVWTYDVFEES